MEYLMLFGRAVLVGALVAMGLMLSLNLTLGVAEFIFRRREKK